MLLNYLVKSGTRKRLLEILLRDAVEGSINDLAHMIGASYAITYEELRAMKEVGLVQMKIQGKANYYSLDKDFEDLALLRKLLYLEEPAERKSEFLNFDRVVASLVYYGAPLYSKKSFGQKLKLEEALALGLMYSKKESILLRTLPIVLYKNKDYLDYNKLWHYSHCYKVKREMGFLLDLTGKLSGDKKLNLAAKKYCDKRYKKLKSYFIGKTKTDAEKELEKINTPRQAKKWLFTMNLGMDSFASFFNKHSAA